MIRPNEDELKALVGVQKHHDWPVVESWLRGCMSQVESRLVNEGDINDVLRYQGKAQALVFILRHIAESKDNLDKMRENTA